MKIRELTVEDKEVIAQALAIDTTIFFGMS